MNQVNSTNGCGHDDSAMNIVIIIIMHFTTSSLQHVDDLGGMDSPDCPLVTTAL